MKTIAMGVREQLTNQNLPKYHEIVMGDPVKNADNYYGTKAGGKLPIGSRKLKKREKRKKRLLYASKFLFLGGAAGLIVLSALRFTSVNTPTVHSAIMNIYYIFFGLIVALHSFGLQKV